MLWRWADPIRSVRGLLPSELISDPAYERILTLADALPAVASSYYLECRFFSGSAVDIMGCVEAAPDRVKALSTYIAESKRTVDRRWNALRKLCDVWADPASVISHAVPHLWLEFDLEKFDRAVQSVLPCPSVLLCLDREYFNKRTHYSRDYRNSLSTEQFQLVSRELISLLVGDNLISHRALQRCFDSLPPSGSLVHLSAMLGRVPPHCKVNLSLPNDEIVAYLSRLAWPGSRTELEESIRPFIGFAETAKCQLSVRHEVGPEFELEFHFEVIDCASGRLRAFLARLHQIGLCSTTIADALFAWPGEQMDNVLVLRVGRWLDVKLVYGPCGSLAAKTYLGFMPFCSRFAL
jgi:hypothetical protein